MIPCTKIFKGIRTVHNRPEMGPLFVWNITPQCNLKCAHCYRESSITNDEAVLSDEKCLQFVDEIKDVKPPVVLLTGGEPLLRKNIFDIIKKCKNVGLRVGLSTNGTLITDGLAKKLKEYDVDYVGISIDGEESFHDEFRGMPGAFRQSWDAIKRLNDIGIKTGIRFTITDGNKGSLLSILDMAVKNDVKRFCLYHLVYSGRGTGDMDVEPNEKRRILTKFFNRVKELADQGKDFEVLTTDNHADGIFISDMIGKDVNAMDCVKSHGGCSAGKRVIYVDSSGDIFPCQFLREESLGNIKEQSLDEIFNVRNNPLLNKLRKMADYVQGKCGVCKHKHVCGGCRARAKAIAGSLWDEDPGCYLKESEICDHELIK